MKKLKNKTFWVLFTIMTTFLVGLLITFNYILYQKEKNKVEYNLNRISNTHNSIDFIINKPIFLDSLAYVVTFNEDKTITSIINYTDNEVNKDKLITLAKLILRENKTKKVGNLYLNKYSHLINDNYLIIIDNSESSNIVKKSFRQSLVIFILIEVIIIYVSVVLTGWLVKPVMDSFEKQKNFIYDASHELKTPLAVILANAEMLESEPNEKKWLTNIKSESIRMNKLVTDMLELSRLENSNDKVYFKNENLSKIVQKTLLTCESLIYENKLKLVTDIKENIYFKCDEDKIKQLVTIFIDNAIKHSYAKSKIKVNLYKEKDNIILEVINRGDAIPKEEQSKIFERFYRADKSRNRNDNRYGIGLTIANSIVSSHKGKINVKCRDGYTTFSVTFKQVN